MKSSLLLISNVASIVTCDILVMSISCNHHHPKMMLSLFVIAVAFFSCSLAQVAKCPSKTCRLKLCNALLRQNLERPDYSANMLRGNGIDMGGAFCFPLLGSRPRPLVEVKLGEASVSIRKSGGPLVKITKFPGVSPAFPSNYFRVKKMPSGLEKITRRKARGNQFEKTDNLCIVLPITSFRFVGPDGSVSSPRTGGFNDCIAIRVQAMRFQFEVVWNNTDDVDLKVVEPTGFRIGRDNRDSPSGGRFNTDVGVDRCSLPLIPGERSRETISWDIDEVPPTGTYIAIGRLHKSCGNGPVKVCLRVSLNGMVAKQKCRVISPGEPSARLYISEKFGM